MQFHTKNLHEFSKQFSFDSDLNCLLNDLVFTSVLHGLRIFVAGGFLRRLVEKRSFNDYSADIDIFFQDHQTFLKFKETVMGGDYFPIEGEWKITIFTNTINIKYKEKSFVIQLVCYKFFDSPQVLLQSFDNYASMISTDGFTIVYENRAIDHILMKILEYNKDFVQKNPLLILDRYVKLVKNGYIASYETKKHMIKLIKNANDCNGVEYDF